jgi:hypothetical protein
MLHMPSLAPLLQARCVVFWEPWEFGPLNETESEACVVDYQFYTQLSLHVQTPRTQPKLDTAINFSPKAGWYNTVGTVVVLILPSWFMAPCTHLCNYRRFRWICHVTYSDHTFYFIIILNLASAVPKLDTTKNNFHSTVTSNVNLTVIIKFLFLCSLSRSGFHKAFLVLPVQAPFSHRQNLPHATFWQGLLRDAKMVVRIILMFCCHTNILVTGQRLSTFSGALLGIGTHY